MNSCTKHRESERGIALIVVLLLMAVLSGLATGFAMTGQTEVQMATNEVYFAGARAAAEAGLNRAIVKVIADTTHNLLAGADGAVDATNASAAVNADNGSVTYLLGAAGPYAIGTSGQYSYTIEILDDDNDVLYEVPLTAAQRAAMGEDGSVYTNTNDRLILRATGRGPNGTIVRIARILETVDTPHLTTTTTTTLANPAILVNGNFEMNGAITVMGSSGGVHANGDLHKTGTGGTITGNATASGSWTQEGLFTAGGSQGGGRPTINVPNIQSSDYIGHADYKLSSSGAVQTLVGGVWTNCSTTACQNTGFTYSGGVWDIAGNSAGQGTYYVEGNVSISGSPRGPGNSNLALSIIATGYIDISGRPQFTPENDAKIQFVSDSDVRILGTVDLDDPTTVEGQIMVRGQFEAGGNMEFQGRVMVQDVANNDNTVAANSNRIHGSVKFTYNGTLGAIESTLTTTSSAPTTYVNNISGWMEQ
ncbi:MAG TPA: hypothetical protein VF491_07660 [Vicinamibacterales bacterium]|jgi:hypothetical protein